MKNGIHVYVQMELEGKQLRNCPTVPVFIRPEHLLEVIANSLADYLIVLGLHFMHFTHPPPPHSPTGDRNMKNETCQARKNGKLVEMKVFYTMSLNLMLSTFHFWQQGTQNGWNYKFN